MLGLNGTYVKMLFANKSSTLHEWKKLSPWGHPKAFGDMIPPKKQSETTNFKNEFVCKMQYIISKCDILVRCSPPPEEFVFLTGCHGGRASAKWNASRKGLGWHSPHICASCMTSGAADIGGEAPVFPIKACTRRFRSCTRSLRNSHYKNLQRARKTMR